MILLDTNVLSELMRAAPDEAVIDWIDSQVAADLHISVITIMEIERSLNLLSKGKRRSDIRIAAETAVHEFDGRCLPFEKTAAIQCGRLAAARQLAGRQISIGDAQIASIALVHEMSLATRNTRDFHSIEGLKLVNPWKSAG